MEQASNQEQAQEVVANWEDWMEAIELGLDGPPARPDTPGSRVWQEIDGKWWTDFPPPPGFDGEQRGEHGQPGYRRRCNLEEQAAVRTVRARDDAEDARRRDVYFARIGVSAPTYP